MQAQVKHVELTLGYMEKLFNDGSMTMTFHILKEEMQNMRGLRILGTEKSAKTY